MQATQVVEECCEACMSGDHHDHRISQVFDYQDIYIGDRMHCRCTYNRRRLPRRIWAQIMMTWTLLLILLGAFQIGLWLMLHGG